MVTEDKATTDPSRAKEYELCEKLRAALQYHEHLIERQELMCDHFAAKLRIHLESTTPPFGEAEKPAVQESKEPPPSSNYPAVPESKEVPFPSRCLANAGQGVLLSTGIDGDRDDVATFDEEKDLQASGVVATRVVSRKLFHNKEEIRDRIKSTQKARIEADLVRKSLYRTDPACKCIGVGHERLESISLAMVALNSLWLTIELDYQGNTTGFSAYVAGDVIFLCYFLFDWAIRIMSLKIKLHFHKDRWLLTDTILLALLAVDTCLSVYRAFKPAGDDLALLEGVQVLRLLRLFRMTRLGRLTRALRTAPELLYLVHGLLAGVRSVAYTMFLLGVILYVFAMIFVIMCIDTDFGQIYFQTVPKSVLSLFQHATLLDGPGKIVDAIVEEQRYVVLLLFFLVIFLTALTLMNMLVGVLCDVVSTVASEDRRRADETFLLDRLKEIFTLIDEDQNLYITQEEFCNGIHQPGVTNVLHDLQIDVPALVDHFEVLYQSDSLGNEYNNRLNFEQVIQILSSLRGDNIATVRDVVELKNLIHQYRTESNVIMSRLADNGIKLERHVKDRQEQLQTRTTRMFNDTNMQLAKISKMLDEERPRECTPKIDLCQEHAKGQDGKQDLVQLGHVRVESAKLCQSTEGHSHKSNSHEARLNGSEFQPSDSYLNPLEGDILGDSFMSGVECGREWANSHPKYTPSLLALNERDM